MPSQVQCLLLVLRKDQSVQSGSNEFVGPALQVCFYACQIEAKYQPVTYLDLFAHRLTWSSIFIIVNGPATLVPPNIFCKKELPIFKGCYVTFMEGTPPRELRYSPPSQPALLSSMDFPRFPLLKDDDSMHLFSQRLWPSIRRWMGCGGKVKTILLHQPIDTVDGRNPAPVDMVVYLIIYKVYMCIYIYISQVVNDMFHQQHGYM